MGNSNSDYVLSAVTDDGYIRAFVATTKATVNEMYRIHNTSPVVSAALGRLLTGASIMGLMLGDEGNLLTISIKTDGPCKGLLVTADHKGMVKGYAMNPEATNELRYDGKLDVAGILGYGTMTVIKDLGLKEPYVGQVPLMSGEIAEDLTLYFAQSEQTPSSVALGVLVDTDYTIKQAGGFIVQLLPGVPEEVILKLESKIENFPSLTKLLDSGKTAEDILDLLLGEFGYKITDKIDVGYHCGCDLPRVEKAIISMGQKELSEIIEDDHKVDIACHFCDKNYHFDENRLRELLTQAK